MSKVAHPFTLLAHLVWLDMRTRYFSSWLGVWVLLLQPLAMLWVYSWVFGELLQLRAGAAHPFFSEHLLAGLIAFNALSEVVTRAPSLLMERRGLLFNTPVPVALLPWIPVGSSLLLEMVGISLLMVWLVAQGVWQWQLLVFYLPWLLIRLLWSSAMSYVLSILGVMIVDLRQVVVPLLSLLLLVTPVFYRLEQIPIQWQQVLSWNPLTLLIQGYQQALVAGQFDASLWLLTMMVSLLVWIGCIQMGRKLMPLLRYVL